MVNYNWDRSGEVDKGCRYRVICKYESRGDEAGQGSLKNINKGIRRVFHGRTYLSATILYFYERD